MSPEYVVLVDEDDNQVGTMLKSEVHGDQTPLHRAFSCFVLDQDHRILVQQRALTKKTRPGVWSNSCCGHPLPDESYADAVVRRLAYELGIYISPEQVIRVSDYRYCFTRYGVMENEVCPIFIVITDQQPVPHPEEVHAYQYIPRDEWLEQLRLDAPGDQGTRSEWCKQEAVLVDERLVKK